MLKAREEIPAYGHAQVLDPSVEPTCTTAGYTKGSHCEVCGEVLKAREEIPAFAHGYNNWEHDEDYHWADCERCGETSDKIVHTMGEDEVCSKCGVSQAELDELVETNPYHPIQISESMLLVVKVIALIALLGILYKIGQFLGFYY